MQPKASEKNVRAPRKTDCAKMNLLQQRKPETTESALLCAV